MKPIKKICIIAGEASGDLHGASLVKALKESGRDLVFFGLGGPRLREAGVEMVYPPPLNVVGFTEVVVKIVHIFRAFQKVKQALVDRSPDLLVLIDYPELNLRLARFAHRRNIPVLFYISPQVWAWRAGRVKTIARVVDRMAVILPFEEEFYRARGMAVEFVGHPLGDALEETLSLEEDPDLPGVGPESTVIGLVAGKPSDGGQSNPAGPAGYRLGLEAAIFRTVWFFGCPSPLRSIPWSSGKGPLPIKSGGFLFGWSPGFPRRP